MLPWLFQRACFHSTCSVRVASPLAELRKKTGYSIGNCKKALDLHSNDISQAEKWLTEQAQNLGWAKATKLQGRSATQGLVGVAVDRRTAVLVEVNCETDFVARSQSFQKLVEAVTHSCLQFASTENSSQLKIHLPGEQMKTLQANPNYGASTLGDLAALTVGSVGENLVLRRAVFIRGSPDTLLAGYAHPAPVPGAPLLGKFGAIVALKEETARENGPVDIGDFAKKICQHIVGMNPTSIGDPSDPPDPDPENEDRLVHQEFLLESDTTVQEQLSDLGVTILDFARLECGQDS